MAIEARIKSFHESYEPEPNSGCWIWIKSTTHDGYGRIRDRGRQKSAHRFSFEIHFGEIPGGLHILHKCDNPACVNPVHLFSGTHQDNMRDRDRKLRNTAGERNARVKLTSDQVISVRMSKKSEREIAKDFGISRSQAHKIKSGKAWKHIQAKAQEVTE